MGYGLEICARGTLAKGAAGEDTNGYGGAQIPMKCTSCDSKACIKRPKTGKPTCIECFFEQFETEIHRTIVENRLFERGQKVAIGASGGKACLSSLGSILRKILSSDSTVSIHVLWLLNKRYDYGLDLILLSIDEGITGYRDHSLKTVQQNSLDYGLPLKILSYLDLYGWTMDSIVQQIGKSNNCTYCGVFRRQALDRGANLIGADILVTGHNCDDLAETVLMNVLRGDISRLSRCASITTGGGKTLPRVKPLKFAYEKEIVLYAHFKKLVYFCTECLYAPNAYRGHAREFIKKLEAHNPKILLNIVWSAEHFQMQICASKKQVMQECTRCGYMSSNTVCQACSLLEGLQKGCPKVRITSGKNKKRNASELDA